MEDIFAALKPLDKHNQTLQSNVHPKDWTNPKPKTNYHLVVIGAGTAGLVTAAGAAGLGARVALIERELMGGDCLNVGCVPSKGLISAARAAHACQNGSPFGVHLRGAPKIEFPEIMARMREKRAQISPMDSVERFSGLGVDVFLGNAMFQGSDRVEVVNDHGESVSLKYKKAVIAAGARAAAPPIPGLQTVRYLTNENLFSLEKLPERFGVIGAGPIGCEMAQVFARLGSHVFLFERSSRILSREDPDAAAIVQSSLAKDGVELILDCQDLEIGRRNDDQIVVWTRQGNDSVETVVDELLVAVGRAPNTDTLNLESVNVQYSDHGIAVNDFLQTSNPRIFAAGDICSRFQFTHSADFQARIVIQNALFALGPFGRRKASQLIIPWATYTSPELAHVGWKPEDASKQGIEIDTFVQSMEHNDRAILESREEGFVKIHTRKGTDQIIGATIVAENAGDLISEITLAMKNKIGLAGIGATIHPYPTQADAIRRLGDQYNKTRLTPLSARILKALMRWNVGR